MTNTETNDKDIGFTKMCPKLAEQIKKAKEYLGERYILHPRSTFKYKNV